MLMFVQLNYEADSAIFRQYAYLINYIHNHPDVSFKEVKNWCKKNPNKDVWLAFRHYKKQLKKEFKKGS